MMCAPSPLDEGPLSCMQQRQVKKNCYPDKFLLLLFLQLERLENKIDNSESREKNNALYRCVVQLEIKDCEFFCDGTGYGGDQHTLQQG